MKKDIQPSYGEAVVLQQVPSVLHGPAEAGGQRRTGRSLQEAVRHVSSPLNHSNPTTKRIDLPSAGDFLYSLQIGAIFAILKP